jgi:uncharacterized membrane-anchored protein YhcB (DUF1043 family)
MAWLLFILGLIVGMGAGIFLMGLLSITRSVDDRYAGE